jgi:carbon starvation protein CstA
MYSFIICFLLLVCSYFVYGKLIERKADTDENRQIPVWKLEDGIDYMPLSKFRGFLSLRNDGLTMLGIISKYLGTTPTKNRQLLL